MEKIDHWSGRLTRTPPAGKHLGWKGPTEREERVIDHYQYLILMTLCLLVTLPLEFVLGARVYRRFRPALLALVPVVVAFTVWDIIGIRHHDWSYNAQYITGARLIFGIPIEELVFFFVVPICGLLTYEAVGNVLQRARRRRRSNTDARA